MTVEVGRDDQRGLEPVEEPLVAEDLREGVPAATRAAGTRRRGAQHVAARAAASPAASRGRARAKTQRDERGPPSGSTQGACGAVPGATRRAGARTAPGPRTPGVGDVDVLIGSPPPATVRRAGRPATTTRISSTLKTPAAADMPDVLLRALERQLVHERDRRVVREPGVAVVERVDDRERVEHVDDVEHARHQQRRAQQRQGDPPVGLPRAWRRRRGPPRRRRRGSR